jgi:hydroxymethylbilane synthase
LRQVEEIKNLFSHIDFKIIKINTQGDKDKITPIHAVEGSDFFTREIDIALLAGEIDLAVHSSKDLPDVLAKGLELAFETPTISPYDALVSKNKLKLGQLLPGGRIGLSSQRRKSQIKVLRPDLEIIDIRGNIEERIALVENGKIEAVIIAHAALLRLRIENKISEILPLDYFPTHPKQGRLAVVKREFDTLTLHFSS